MKSLNISFFLPTLNIGGIERVFVTYANYLSENKRYKCSFILCKNEGKLLSTVSPNVEIYELGAVKLRYSFFKLRKWLKRHQPDFIFTGGDFPNFITIISSLGLTSKVIISQHNYYNIESKRLGWWAYSSCYLMKRIYPLAHKILAISNGIYNFLLNDIGINSNKIVKIPNPIDINIILERSNEIIDIELPSKYIVFIGRLSYVKNLIFLFDAFEKAKLSDDIHLIIVGDGEMKHELEEKKQIMSKGQNVRFLGSLENPLPILKNASLLVLPSLSEAYPTILLESLCLSIPILSTPTKGAIEILNNIPGTTISKDCSDVNYFASSIERSIISSLDINKAQKIVEKHSINIIGNKIENEIINNNESFN